MRARALVITCALAAIGAATLADPTSGAGAPAGPGAVSGLAPFQKQGPVTLSWTNPRDIDRDVVRLARGTTAPATPADGRAVALAHRIASQVVLDRLGDGAQYSVSVWTKRNGVLSHRATTTFITKMFRSTPGGGPGTLAGQVVDTAGDPLRNAVVTAADFATFSHLYKARTDGDGRFDLTVPRGDYLVGSAGPHATGGASDATGYQYDFDAAPVHTGRAGLRFVLADGGALTGTVTDSRGAPLRGVRLGLQPAPAYLQQSAYGSALMFITSGPGSAATDAAGRYRVTGLPPGALVPCFATRGAGGGHFDRRGYLTRCADRSVAVSARQIAQAAPVVLQPVSRTGRTATGAIAGTVTTSSGTPARGTRITAFGALSAAVRSRADARGRYRVSQLAPGWWDVCAFHRFADKCKRVRVEANRTSPAALHFAPSGTLSGVVVGPRGDRLANASVSLDHTTAHGGSGEAIETDQRGAWTLGGLAPGLWHVCFGGGASAADPTGGRAQCLAKKVRVSAGRDRIGVDGHLAPGGAVAGTVTDSAGHPVPGANVTIGRRAYSIGPQEVTTDRHGRFVAGGLAPGAYRVCAEVYYDSGGVLQGCTAGSPTVTAGHLTPGADIALPADAPLTATVTDTSAHPLSGVDVALLQACRVQMPCENEPVFSTTRGVQVSASAVTGPDGSIVFHGLQPGRYVACALAYYAASASTTVPTTGYADRCAGRTFAIQVARGGHAATSIALEPGAAVSGRVVDASGSGLAGVAMRIAGSAASDYTGSPGLVSPLIPSPRNDAVTDAHGRYLVRSVAPGTRGVCGVPPSGSGARPACLADPVGLSAATTTAAPTLMLPAAARSAQGARIALTTPLSLVRPPLVFAPASRRLQLVSSTGRPEYRLLPRH